MKSESQTKNAILLMHCADQEGIVATVTEFVYKNGGNIVYLDQHVDQANKVFFMRIEWEISKFVIPAEKIGEFFDTLIGKRFGMHWSLHFSDERPRMAVFVSKYAHCLYDILARWHAGEWNIDLPVIISNHSDLQGVAEKFGIPFCIVDMKTQSKEAAEAQQIALCDQYGIDLIVLARYMQIVSPGFIARYENRMINIHHSFLPAFPGSKPYHSAHERGVKIIGASSHYVSAELDAGPIIEQDVIRVNHTDSIDNLIRKGRDLEKIVLARAIYLHLQRRTLVHKNRTIVFD